MTQPYICSAKGFGSLEVESATPEDASLDFAGMVHGLVDMWPDRGLLVKVSTPDKEWLGTHFVKYKVVTQFYIDGE